MFEENSETRGQKKKLFCLRLRFGSHIATAIKKTKENNSNL